MARLPRLDIAGIPQHVVQRGNNRQACFFCDADRSFYINKLQEAADKFDVKVHAFVLMTNHVHLLMTQSEPTMLSRVMQTLGRNYVKYINVTYRRTGTLWEERFKSSLVQSGEHVLTVYKYIELNPVRANMVANPGDYVWSSYHHNVGTKNIGLVTPHPEYLSLGDLTDTRCENYKALFRIPLIEDSVNSINDCLSKSKIYGNDKFKAEIAQNLKRKVEPKDHGGDRRSVEFQKLYFQDL